MKTSPLAPLIAHLIQRPIAALAAGTMILLPAPASEMAWSVQRQKTATAAAHRPRQSGASGVMTVVQYRAKQRLPDIAAIKSVTAAKQPPPAPLIARRCAITMAVATAVKPPPIAGLIAAASQILATTTASVMPVKRPPRVHRTALGAPIRPAMAMASATMANQPDRVPVTAVQGLPATTMGYAIPTNHQVHASVTAAQTLVRPCHQCARLEPPVKPTVFIGAKPRITVIPVQVHAHRVAAAAPLAVQPIGPGLIRANPAFRMV